MHFLNNIFYKLFYPLFLSIIPMFAYGSDNLKDLEVIGKPEPGGINFQPAVTELARDIRWLDNFLLVIITLISLFVIVLLGIVVIKFNKFPVVIFLNGYEMEMIPLDYNDDYVKGLSYKIFQNGNILESFNLYLGLDELYAIFSD